MWSLTPGMILISKSALGLSTTGYKAIKNSYKVGDLDSDINQRWLEMVRHGWADGTQEGNTNIFKLTGRGLDQLRLQMGEFVFSN